MASKLKSTRCGMLSGDGSAILSADLQSLLFSVHEKLVHIDANGHKVALQDISLADGNAYPFAITLFAFVPRMGMRTSCQAKAEATKFLKWMLEAPNSANLAAQDEIAVLPAEMRVSLQVIQALEADLTCDDTAVKVNSQNQLSIQVQGEEIRSAENRIFSILIDAFQVDNRLFRIETIAVNDSTSLTALMNNMGIVSEADTTTTSELDNTNKDTHTNRNGNSSASIEAAAASIDIVAASTNEADLSFIQADLFSNTDQTASFYDTTIRSPNGLFFAYPWLIYNVVPLFHLPTSLQQIRQGNTTSARTVARGNSTSMSSTTTSIRLDLDTLARIFLGDIRAWNDPSVLQFNPNLAAALKQWQQAQTTVTAPNIVIFLCCSDPAAPLPVSSSFFAALNSTKVFSSRLRVQYPINTTVMALQDYLSTKGVPVHVAKNEVQMTADVQSLPFSIGYHLMEKEALIIDQEVTLTRTLNNGTTVDLQPGTSSSIQCVQSLETRAIRAMNWRPKANAYTGANSISSDDNTIELPDLSSISYVQYVHELSRISGQSSGDLLNSMDGPSLATRSYLSSLSLDALSAAQAVCSPFQWSQSLVLPRQYFGIGCIQGEYTLRLAEYLLTSSRISQVGHARSIVRLSENPQWNDTLKSILHETQCDGYPILRTRPTYWSLSVGLKTIGIGVAVAGWIVCLLSLAIIIKYRKHPLLMATSMPFQLCQVVGLLLLFAVPLLLVQSHTKANCSFMFATLNIGLVLRLAPLFLKLTRIYLIFGRNKLSLVRLSNGRLGLCLLLLMVIEFIQQISFLSVAPLHSAYMSESARTEHGIVEHYYSYCAIDINQGDSQAARGLLGWIAASKVALLAWGVFVAMKTRTVASKFNESHDVAWMTWLVLFGGLLGAGVILITHAKGDFYHGVLLVLSVFVPCVSWALSCLTKFVKIFEDVQLQKQLQHQHAGALDPQNGKAAAVFGGASKGAETMQFQALMDVHTSMTFDFPSLDQMDEPEVIDRYIRALEKQIYQARKRWIAQGHASRYSKPLTIRSLHSRVGVADDGISIKDKANAEREKEKPADGGTKRMSHKPPFPQRATSMSTLWQQKYALIDNSSGFSLQMSNEHHHSGYESNVSTNLDGKTVNNSVNSAQNTRPHLLRYASTTQAAPFKPTGKNNTNKLNTEEKSQSNTTKPVMNRAVSASWATSATATGGVIAATTVTLTATTATTTTNQPTSQPASKKNSPAHRNETVSQDCPDTDISFYSAPLRLSSRRTSATSTSSSESAQPPATHGNLILSNSSTEAGSAVGSQSLGTVTVTQSSFVPHQKLAPLTAYSKSGLSKANESHNHNHNHSHLHVNTNNMRGTHKKMTSTGQPGESLSPPSGVLRPRINSFPVNSNSNHNSPQLISKHDDSHGHPVSASLDSPAIRPDIPESDRDRDSMQTSQDTMSKVVLPPCVPAAAAATHAPIINFRSVSMADSTVRPTATAVSSIFNDPSNSIDLSSTTPPNRDSPTNDSTSLLPMRENSEALTAQTQSHTNTTG